MRATVHYFSSFNLLSKYFYENVDEKKNIEIRILSTLLTLVRGYEMFFHSKIGAKLLAEENFPTTRTIFT